MLATAWVDRRRHHQNRFEWRLAAYISDLWPNPVFVRTRERGGIKALFVKRRSPPVVSGEQVLEEFPQ